MSDTATTESTDTLVADLQRSMFDESDSTPEPAQPRDAKATTEITDESKGQPDKPAEDATEAETESATDEAEGKQEPDKTSDKAAKEEARKDKTWQQINAEKEAVRKEREAIEAEKAEIARIKGEQARKTLTERQPFKDQHGHTADEYEAAAKRWEGSGERSEDDIKAARAHAQGLRQQEAQAQAEAQRETIDHIIRQNPDLRNPASQLATTLRQMVAEDEKKPFYAHIPDGWARMVDDAKTRMKADSVSVLEKKITELTKENERLTKLSTPARGSSGKVSSSNGDSKDAIERDLEAALAAGAF